ncbi:flavodoxin family protein [Candidatus Bathyarchaeota archaeon]|nr:flavodoxin family protein [Candidatus Bathyarchaeota archaeon]
MARVLGFLGSARRDGYTVKVLKEALEGAKSIQGVEAELIYLLDYKFGPCTSCYECIRRSDHRCVLQDDMGQLGEGKLWKKIEGANGFIFAAPVHFWSADALSHLFIERLYPFLWSGELKGIPVATITVASNQGFQFVANTMLCEWAFTMVMKYVGGLPVHAAYLDEALPRARYLGMKLGEAALKDEKEGRKAPTDEEIWLYYQDKPWRVFPHYIENLTMGTGNPELSVIKRSLAHGTFKRKEAVDLLKKADEEFDKFSYHYSLGNYEEAIKSLVKASAFWTHATWKEFLEEQLIKAPPPKVYRPVEE